MTEATTYCAVHPERETSLRCNKCGRYMCPDCAVPTPVGYRCKQCIRQVEDKFFTAGQNDYVVIAAICGLLAALAGGIISAIGGFLLLSLLLAIPAGGVMAEAALRATGRRRGRYSPQVGAAAVVVGGLLGGVIQVYLSFERLLQTAASGQAVPEELRGFILEAVVRAALSDLGLWLFVGVAAFAVYGRFRMRM